MREEVPQYFTHDPNFGIQSTCIIAQDGDLIDGMALRIVLPEIPRFQTTNGVDPLTRFAWIRQIGYAMIRSVEIEINGKIIDRHYGEWMHIWSTLTTKNSNEGLKKMIGDVPELYEFTNGKPEYTLYVPLYFWFCRATGQAIPLVCLQYCDIKINVEFYDIEKCYLVTPTHYIKCTENLVNLNPGESLYQKGIDGIERFGTFAEYDNIEKKLYYLAISTDKLTGIPYDGNVSLLDQATKTSLSNSPKAERYNISGVSSDQQIKPELGTKSVVHSYRPIKRIELKECTLLVNYVYLDTDERFKFAQTKQDYLIEQLYFTPNIQIESINRKVKLDIDQPCKLTVWLAQLDYIEKINDRFNYTDSHIYKKYYDTGYTNPLKIKTFGNAKVDEQIGNSLITEGTILLNSQNRLETRTNTYFETIQPVQHTEGHLPQGCGMYSYALQPTSVQPSGTTNMSQIELIELMLKMNYRLNVDRKAKFRSYSLCYNVWRVNNGLSATVFTR